MLNRSNPGARLIALTLLALLALMPLGALAEDAASTDLGTSPGETAESSELTESGEPDEMDVTGEVNEDGGPIEDTPEPDPSYDAGQPENLIDGNLTGSSCVLIDRSNGDVLYDKNASARMYPASTTKIMTLLLAVEYGNFSQIVEIPAEAKQIPSDSSKVPVLPGERMSLDALLYGLMLPSGNDAANSVAMIVSGSLDAFVERMNQRAAELGCEDTHFVNPHGYHDPNHYTTAMDMAKIAAEGMKHLKFRQIVSSPYFTMPATKFRAQGMDIENSNLMLLGSSEFYYSEIQGIKTGHHQDAGYCFVAAAARDGINLISVTLNATRDGRWNDARRLMEFGFAQYRDFTFGELYAQKPIEVAVQGAEPDDPMGGKLLLNLAPNGSLNGYSMRIRPEIGPGRLALILDNSEIAYTPSLTAPIRAGTEVGTITARYADGTALTATLLAARDVNAPPAVAPIEEPEEEDQSLLGIDTGSLRLIGIGIGALILVAVALMIASLRAKRARERERRRRAAQRRKRIMQQQRRREMDR